MLRRMSSSLVNVEVAGQNTRPLGRLQPEGRTHYRPAPSTRFGARSHFPGADRLRGGLLPSGIPTALVQRWHAGSISGDLALREILDAVCRVRSGRDASPEERRRRRAAERGEEAGDTALERDRKDAAQMIVPEDSICVDTEGRSIEQVIEAIVQLSEERA